MSLSIDVAGTAIPTDASQIKSLQSDEALVFSLGAAWLSVLDLTLGTVPTAFVAGDLKYAGPAVTFPLGPVTFGLQANTSASLLLHKSGLLLSFQDGLEQPAEQSVTVSSGVAYLELTLNLNLSGNATFTYSGGAYGITSELDATCTYAVSFYKAFAPTTPVRQALAALFESFVLPLHKETFQHLSEGDYLLHEFDGNLHLAFGAYGGVDSVVYAGQSAIDLSKTLGSPLASFAVGAKPEIKAKADLNFTLQYSSQFEALLSRSDNAGRLHLFRSTKRDAQTKFAAGMTISLNGSVALTPTAPATLQQSLIGAAGGTSSLGGKAVAEVLNGTGATAEVQKYVTDANDKLTAWINKANGRQTNLEVTIDSQLARTILAGYTFDLASPSFDQAWQHAYNGDLVAALGTGAVTLDAGSGLEQEYQRKTSCTCNIFGLFKYSGWDQFSSNTSLVYAGHNTLHLVETVSHATESQALGALRILNLYFTADASVLATGALSNAQVQLHLNITAKGDRKAIASMSRLIGALGAPALARDLAAFSTNQKQGTAELNITVSPAASGHIEVSASSADLQPDARNWQAFAQAADDLSVWPLQPNGPLNDSVARYFKSFAAWELFNKEATGASSVDRAHIGNALSAWPDAFPSVSLPHAMIVYSMLAGQRFMSFCASLRTLANLSQTASTDTLWTDLNKQMSDALKQESDVDFIRPAILAVIRLCETPSTMTGPAVGTTPAEHFAVSIKL